jgi:hypothetical protein
MGDWVAARSLASQGQNSLAKRLLEWRYAHGQKQRRDFCRDRCGDQRHRSQKQRRGVAAARHLQARAEAQITPELPPATVAAWFAARPPNSSIGKIRYGRSLGGDRRKDACAP